MASVALIIPVLNEAAVITSALQRLQALRMQGVELLVVDGGSRDNTFELAKPFADQVIHSTGGRSGQMNAGANHTAAEWLFFLHVDTVLPESFGDLLLSLDKASPWGFFPLRLSGQRPAFRLIANAINWRSRLSGIGTGDQLLFAQRDYFFQHGGFSDIPLMEDVDLSKRLRKQVPPRVFDKKVTTSSRRWEQNGVVRTVLLMWALRLAYFLGVPPRKLARYYH